jgi:hypothetical protein
MPLELNPDRQMADNLRKALESEGDTLANLRTARLGPGHVGEIVCVVTAAHHRGFISRKVGAISADRDVILAIALIRLV